jgi:hypothetical protein
VTHTALVHSDGDLSPHLSRKPEMKSAPVTACCTEVVRAKTVPMLTTDHATRTEVAASMVALTMVGHLANRAPLQAAERHMA